VASRLPAIHAEREAARRRLHLPLEILEVLGAVEWAVIDNDHGWLTGLTPPLGNRISRLIVGLDHIEKRTDPMLSITDVEFGAVAQGEFRGPTGGLRPSSDYGFAGARSTAMPQQIGNTVAVGAASEVELRLCGIRGI
jgi:hypothetical protein